MVDIALTRYALHCSIGVRAGMRPSQGGHAATRQATVSAFIASRPA
jgi:hypothetical protein